MLILSIKANMEYIKSITIIEETRMGLKLSVDGMLPNATSEQELLELAKDQIGCLNCGAPAPYPGFALRLRWKGSVTNIGLPLTVGVSCDYRTQQDAGAICLGGTATRKQRLAENLARY